MNRPQPCVALLALRAAWLEYQRSIDLSMRRGEMTDDEILARQNYDAALTQIERVTQPQSQQEALCA